MKTTIYMALGIMTLMFMSCSSSKNEMAEPQEETTIESETTASVISTPADQSYTIYGTVGTRPAGKRDYYAMADAFIDRLEVYEGMSIKKGQVIYTARSPQVIQLQQELLDAKTNMEWAKNELERMDTLLQYNAVAKKNYKEMEKDYRLYLSKYQATKQQLNIIGISASTVESGNIQSHISARSDVDGVVEQVYVSAGAKIGQDQRITSIINKASYIVEFMVDRDQVRSLEEGDILFGRLSTSTTEVKLKVSAISDVTVTETNKIRLECEIMNPEADIRYGDAVMAELMN